MDQYDKIQTVFKRETHTKKNRIVEGDYSLPEFEYLKDNQWDFTEKLDGTNVRIMIKEMRVSYGGKTDNAQLPTVLVDWLRQKFDPLTDKLLTTFPEGACIYGEGVGSKIQKGGGNYGDPHFVVFDVKVGPWWLQRPNVISVAEECGLPVVPLIGQGTLHDLVRLVRAGITSTYGEFRAEGVVARPRIELRQRNGDRIITKLKCRDFDP